MREAEAVAADPTLDRAAWRRVRTNRSAVLSLWQGLSSWAKQGVLGCESRAPTDSAVGVVRLCRGRLQRGDSQSNAHRAAQPNPYCDGRALSFKLHRELYPRGFGWELHPRTHGRQHGDSDLLGAWTLTIDSCAYRIAVDGLEQGGGRVELVEGEAEAGRLAFSEDLGCPNEFTGSAFYDFSLDGSSLTIEEAIAGTDLCEGRAGAFVGSPAWTR